MNFADLSKSLSEWFFVDTTSGCEPTLSSMVDLQSLEERVLYSAAPVPLEMMDGSDVHADAFQDMTENYELHLDDLQLAVEELESLEHSTTLGDLSELPLSGEAVESSTELIVVDRTVAAFEVLVDDILEQSTQGRTIEVLYIDSSSNGVMQLSEYLQNSDKEFDSLHLISHGSNGSLQFGNAVINSSNLADFGADFESWKPHLADGADILIYGCEVAQTVEGEAFVNDLAEMTGADIAASDDLTGHESLGGDWRFEYTVGFVETDEIVTSSIVSSWEYTLIQFDATSEGAGTWARAGGDQALDGTTNSIGADYFGNVVYVASTDDGSLATDGFDVFVQREATNGTLASWTQVNNDSVGDQKWASVAVAENGGYVVVWTTENSGSFGVWASIYAADGTIVKDDFQVDTPGSNGNDAEVAIDSAGNFVIAFEAGDGAGDGIYSVQYDAVGNVTTALNRVNTNTAGDQGNVAVAMNDQGDVVYAWDEFSETNIGEESRIWMFKDFGDGITADVEGVAIDFLDQVYTAPAIDIDSEGKYVVVSNGDPTQDAKEPAGGFAEIGAVINNNVGVGIIFATFDADGSERTTVATDITNNGLQYNPTVAFFENDTFMYVYEGRGDDGYGGTDEEGVYREFYTFDGQRIDAAGNAIGGGADDVPLIQDAVHQDGIDPVLVGPERIHDLQRSGAVATYHGGTEYIAGFTGISWETGAPEDGYHWTQSATFVDTVPTGSSINIASPEDVAFVLNETQFVFNDPDANALTTQEFAGVTLASDVTNGKLILNGTQIGSGDFVSVDDIKNGSLTFRPDANFSGPADFDFYVHNQKQQSTDSYTFTFDVQPVVDGGEVVGGTELASIDGPELVNDTFAGDQDSYRTTALDNGGYVVTWQSEVGGESKVFLSVFDSSGTQVLSESRADTNRAGAQTDADVAALAGGFVVAWTQDAATVTDVVAQRFDNAGNEVGSDFDIAQYDDARQYGIRIDSLDNGGFVASWTSSSTSIDSDFGIAARVFDGTGSGQQEFLVNDTVTAGIQGDVELTVLENNRVFISWSDKSGVDDDLRGRFVDLDDVSAINELSGTINVATASKQTSHSVTALLDGSLVVVWESQNDADGSGIGVYARKFDAQMNTSGPDIQINQETLFHQEEPTVVGLADGGFMVLWQSDTNDAEGASIVGRRFDSGAAPVGDEFVVNSRVAGDQVAPEAIQLTNGEIVVVYGDADGDNNGPNFGVGVFAERFEFSASGEEDSSINLHINYGPTDDSETLSSFVIGGIPAGAKITDGVTIVDPNGAGQVDVMAAGLVVGDLAIIPPMDDHSDIRLNITTTFEESDSSVSASITRSLVVKVAATDDTSASSSLSDSVNENTTTTIATGDLTSSSNDVDIDSALTYTPSSSFGSGDIDTSDGGGEYQWNDGLGSKHIHLDSSGVTYVPDSGSAIPTLNNVYEFNGTAGGEIDVEILNDFKRDGVIDLWIKPSDLTGTKVIFDHSGSDGGFVIYQEDTKVVVEIHDVNHVAGSEPVRLVADGLSTSEFNQISLVVDSHGVYLGQADVPDAALFLNGQLADQAADINTIARVYNFELADKSGLGQFLDSSFVDQGRFTNFTGQIAKFEVFNDSAAGNEVEQRYLNEINIPEVVEINGASYAAGSTIVLSSNAEVFIESNGDLTYDPNGQFDWLGQGESTTDSFTYVVENGTGQSEVVTVNITVNGVGPGAPTDLSPGIAFNYDGGNDVYFGTLDTAFLDGVGDFTFEISFASEDTGATTPLISYKIADGGNDEFSLKYNGDGTLAFDTVEDNGSAASATLNGFDYSTLFDGERHTLAFSFDTSSGEWKIFADGIEVERNNDSNIQDITFTGGGSLVFGQEQDSPNGGFDSNEHFEGTIFDVRVWDRKTGAAQADDYLNRQIAPSDIPARLIANWQFNSLAGGTTVTNIIDAGNPLTLGHAAGAGFTASSPVTQFAILEDASNGAIVGAVTPVDRDADETYTYLLTDNANGQFAISNEGQITLVDSSKLDAETKPSETIEIEVTDSNGHSYTESFQVAIRDVNETPKIDKLLGLTVTEDSTGNKILNTRLQILDPDLADTSAVLEYTLDSVPSQGVLRLNGGALGINSTFTQEDIDLERLTYDHVGDTPASQTFDFTVSDGTFDVSGTFTIDIDPVNDDPFKVNNYAVDFTEGVPTNLIHRTALEYQDPDDVATQLTYTLDAKPSFGDLIVDGTVLDDGDTFTQEQINGDLLRYTHLGNESTSDSFDFTVRDGGEDSAIELTDTFTINVIASNDPVAIADSSMSVNEGSTGNPVDDSTLVATDPDDNPDQLIYTVMSEPLFGTIRKLGTALAINDTFTHQQVIDGDITFDAGYSSSVDSVALRLADGLENGATPQNITLSFDVVLANDPITDLTNGIEINVDGDDAYFIAADGDALFGNVQEFTYEISFSSTNQGEINVLGSYRSPTDSGANDDAFRVNLTTDGSIAIVINGQAQISTGIDYSQLLDGSLHSLAISWNSVQGHWQVYADGELADSGLGLATGESIRSNGTFVVGHEQDSVNGGFDNQNEFKGTLHDIRLWSDVKSAEEINGNQNAKFDSLGLPPGLIANWQFNELAAGGKIVDAVSGNDLTLSHLTDPMFVTSTVDGQLDIDENSTNGTIVGHVLPTDSEYTNDLIFDGAFTSPAEPPNMSYDEYTAGQFLGDWEVLTNGVDLRGSTWEQSPLGGRALDMTSDSGQGSLGQLLDTVAGEVYEVTFAMSGNFEGSETTQTLDVIVDGVATSFSFDESAGWSRSNLQWETRTLTFTADSASTQIVFEGTSGFRRGAIFSDVSVVAIHTPDQSANQFTLLDDADSRFAIDSATGEITVADSSKLDFETDASHTIRIRVADADNQEYIETVSIVVNDLNEAPGVNITSITVDEGSANNVINGTNLMETDPDDSGDQLTYKLVGEVTHGVLRLGGNVLLEDGTFTQDDVDTGRLTYDHDGTETSIDSFDFTIADGGEDGIVPQPFSFTINIDAVNDAPTLTIGDFSMVDVVVNNVNPPGETVATMLASSSGTPVGDSDTGDVLGIAVVGVDNTNGDWQYSTNEGTTWASISSAGSLGSNGLVLDETARIRFVPNNDYVGPAGELTFRAWDQSDGSASGDVVVTDFAGADGAFSNGIETVTLDVFAGSGIENTVPGPMTTPFEVPVVFSTATGNAISVSDTNANDSQVRVTLTVTDGILNINSAATGILFVNGTTDGSNLIEIYGYESDLNVALDGLTFTPDAGFDGNVSLDVTTDIEFGQVVGFTDTSPDASSSIAVNDPERGNVVEFGPGEFAQIRSGGNPTRLGEPSSVTLAGWVNVAPTGADGEFISIADSVAIRVDSAAHGNSVTGFFFDGTSDQATTSSQAIAGTGWHHIAFTIDETTNTQKLYIDGSLVNTTNHAGSINYQNFGTFIGVNPSNGANDFEGRVDDIFVFNRVLAEAEILAMREEGLSDSDSISITVEPNLVPVAHDNIYGVEAGGTLSIGIDRGLLYNDTDGDGHSLQVTNIISGPSNGTLSTHTSFGTFVYVQDGPVAATDSFTYEVSDGKGGVTTAVALIHIDPTGLVSSSEFAVNEESSVVPDESAGHPLSAAQSLDQNDRPSNSSVAINDNGDYVVVWTSEGTDGTSNVLMRMFDFSGNPVTDQTVVQAEDGIKNSGASIAMGPDGEFVIVWARGDSSEDIVFQKYDAVGNKVGGVQQVDQDPDNSMVDDFTFGSQLNPNVSYNGNGDIVFVWDGAFQKQDGSDRQHDIYLQRFFADGTIDDVVQVETPTGGFEFNANPVFFDNGDVFLTWDDNDGIRGAIVAADGSVGTSYFIEEVGTNTSVQRSSVAANQSGLVVIAYEREVPDGSGGTEWNSFIKVVDPYNPVVEAEFEGPASTTGDQRGVDIAFTDDGNIVLTWSGQSTTDGADTHDVFARRFQVVDLGGSYVVEALSDEFVVSSSSGKQHNASVAALDSENFVVVWSGEGAGDSEGIFAKQYGDQTDLVSLSGEVFEDVSGDAQRDAGDLGVEKAVVNLYRDDGDGIANDTDLLIRSVETDATGSYLFTGLKSTDTYWVVVDSKTIIPLATVNAGFANDNAWAQQTIGDGGVKYGGLNAGVSDNAMNLSTAQHVSRVDFTADPGTSVDFGFSFNVVTNNLGGDSTDHSGSTTDNRSVQGSLRQFIANANAIVGGNHMRFVPVVNHTESLGSDHWWEIAIDVALPHVQDDDTFIDGTAHDATTGLAFNSNTINLGETVQVGVGPAGADGVAGTGDELPAEFTPYMLDGVDAPDLEIHDINGVASGLVVSGANVEIAYVSIHGFGDGVNGGNIVVNDSGEFANIHDNVIGSDASAFAQGPTATSTMHNIVIVGADNGRIEGNLIGFAGSTGIKFSNSAGIASSWDVVNNEIRGNGHERPGQDGVDILSGSNIRVTSNLIVDNHGYGVDTYGNNGDVFVFGNTISGNGQGGTEQGGIRLFGTDNTVERNVITGNLGSGVVVQGQYDDGASIDIPSLQNLISQNSFSSNDGVGIDLVSSHTDAGTFMTGDGITENSVSDTGAGNVGLDFPELSHALIVSGGLEITAQIAPSLSVDRIEVYASNSGTGDSLNANDHYGEGQIYLGTISNVGSLLTAAGDLTAVLLTPANGWPVAIAEGTTITTIAIDGDNNTSEFSRNIDVNQIPEAKPSTVTLLEDGTHTFASGDFNLSDAPGATLEGIRIDLLPANGSFTYKGNPVTLGLEVAVDDIGLLEFTPDKDLYGSPLTTFEFSVNDGETYSRSSATMAIRVTPVNDSPELPVGTDVSFSATEDTPFSITPAELIADLTDAEGDTLTPTLVSGPSNGTLILQGDGTFLYSPNTNFNGTDTFMYEVSDGNLGTKLIEATIIVAAENDAPVLGDPGKLPFDENSTDAAFTFAGTDVEGDKITYSLAGTGPDDHLFNIVDDEIFFISPPDFENPNGSGGNTYVVDVIPSDADEGIVRRIEITVRNLNDAPVAMDDKTTVDEGGTISGTLNVLANDVDTLGDGLSIKLLSSTSHGFLELKADGTFEYVHGGSESPTNDAFEYEVTSADGQTDTATVIISINPVNDAPVLKDPGPIPVAENTTAAVVQLAGTDAEGDAVSFQIAGTGPDDSLFTVIGDEVFFVDPPDFENPKGSAGNTYFVDVIPTDGADDGLPVRLEINVTDVNDAPPVANNDSLTISEGEHFISTQSVLVNDVDPQSAGLTVSLVTDVNHGSLTLNADGTFEYEHDGSETPTTDSFVYEVTSSLGHTDTATFTFTIDPINDVPVIDDPGLLTQIENLTGPIVTLSGSDGEGDSVNYRIAGSGADDHLFTMVGDEIFFVDSPDFETPGGSAGNTYFVDVVANDGTEDGDTRTLEVRVLDANDAPVANDDAWTVDESENYVSTFNLLDNDVVFGDGMTVSLVSGTSQGEVTVNSDGTFSYVHDGSEPVATDSFVYQVMSADGQTDTAMFTFTIDPVQDATQVNDDGIFFVDSDEVITLESSKLLANDFDPDSTDLQIVIVSQPAAGNAFIDASGNLVFEPDVTASGIEEIEYVVVADGVTSESARVTFAVAVAGQTQTVEVIPEPEENIEETTEPQEEIAGGQTNDQKANTTAQTAESNIVGSRINDLAADTFEGSSADFESASDDLILHHDSYHTTYAFAGDNSNAATEFTQDFVRAVSGQLGVSSFDPVMLGVLWNEMDSAKKDFLMKFDFNTPSIAASVTSFLTVGYLAWIIRGGVLLTTFMSSIPAWQSFDPLPVIESAGRDEDEDDESIAQMIDN